MPLSNSLSKKQLLQLAAEAQVDPRTVATVYDGRRCWSKVRERLTAAAKKLKIAMPPAEEEK